MSTATSPPLPDPVSVLKALNAEAIRARLAELDAEASALRVLLRSARAREQALRRQRREEVADAPSR
jgi:hypothetical protein